MKIYSNHSHALTLANALIIIRRPGSGNQIDFESELVSRNHFRVLKIGNGGPFILKTHEGPKTFLQGVRVRPRSIVVLFPGAVVHLGDPANGNYVTVCFLRKPKVKECSQLSTAGAAIIAVIAAVSATPPASSSAWCIMFAVEHIGVS